MLFEIVLLKLNGYAGVLLRYFKFVFIFNFERNMLKLYDCVNKCVVIFDGN